MGQEAAHQYEARKLRSSVHHLSVQYELLKHENEGLKEALQHKKKHRKKGKALDLQQRQEYHGGSVFWSPRKLREARAREAVRERDETEEKLQKARSKKQREEARLQRQDELEERRVERQRLKEMRELERAEKAAERARQKEERDAAKALQLSQKGKRKASQVFSASSKRQKRVRAARAGAQVQEEPPAPPPKLTHAPAQGGSQTALRWLGVWFDRGLTFKKHVAERAAQARKVANHLRSLANTAHGPPAGSLRKAAITCILPILLYGAETWYEGRTKNPRIARVSRKPTVSTRVGWHLTTIDQALIAATKAILPAWRTTPNAVLLREAAMPSAQVALEEAKLRFAVHLRTIDDKHPLTNRTTLPLVIRGRAAGNRRIPRSKVQRVAQLLPATPRNVLASPHFSDGSRQDPTQGQGKDIAAQNFTIWWESLGQETITVFSDGSEQQINGTRVVTYGYAIYQGQAAVATGQGSLNALSHVFDAEAIGACRGLKHALQLSLPSQREIVLCIDSTSVI
ncbi:DUF1682 multi-domain protein [Pyrenophora tritici-repentis]|nr:DUF1682 multi-domain protein [Pyrenophora tritici-repentis]